MATSLDGNSDFSQFSGLPIGLRKVSGIDGRKLRLFYLSLLWRAAASRLPEFADVQLDPIALERLRVMVLTSHIDPPDFFPISLIQLSTRGVTHNQVVIQQVKTQGGMMGLPLEYVPFFRIYIDGLVAHLGTGTYSQADVADLGPLIVGNEKDLVISTVIFQGSTQLRNLMLENSVVLC